MTHDVDDVVSPCYAQQDAQRNQDIVLLKNQNEKEITSITQNHKIK